MTDLLIATPDIPSMAVTWDALNSSATPGNYEDFFPPENTMRGWNWQRWTSSQEDHTHYIYYDLGQGNTATASYLLVSQLYEICEDWSSTTANVELQYSSDGSSWSVAHTNDLNTANADEMFGPFPTPDIYFKTFTATAARRYWRVKFFATDGTTDIICRAGKIYFGTLFDLGCDVGIYEPPYKSTGEIFQASSGARYSFRSDWPELEVNLEWNGVTDAKLASFYSTIVAHKLDTCFFLITSSFHGLLNNRKVLPVKLIEASSSFTDKPDWNLLRATFREAY